MSGTRNRISLIISVIFLLVVFNVDGLIAGEISAADQEIIDAGVKKAKELDVNPIPMCEEEDGNNYIPGGFMFNISNGGFALKNGDMLINATKGTITAVGVDLDRGEYAIIENDKATKGEKNLISK